MEAMPENDFENEQKEQKDENKNDLEGSTVVGQDEPDKTVQAEQPVKEGELKNTANNEQHPGNSETPNVGLTETKTSQNNIQQDKTEAAVKEGSRIGIEGGLDSQESSVDPDSPKKYRRKKTKEEREERRRKRKERKESVTQETVVKDEPVGIDEGGDSKTKVCTEVDEKDAIDGTSPEPVAIENFDEVKGETEIEAKAVGHEETTVEDTPLSQRHQEKEAFQNLIDEIVKLTSDLQKAQKKLEKSEHKETLLVLELDALKDEHEEDQETIKKLETNLKASEYRDKGSRRGSATSSENRDKERQIEGLSYQTSLLASKVKDGQETESYLRQTVAESKEEKEQLEQKVKDLQLRLTRMTKDCEEKDKRMYATEQELKEITTMVNELEKYVDRDRVEQIKADHEMGGNSNGNVTKYNHGDTNIVGGEKTPSKTCLIM